MGLPATTSSDRSRTSSREGGVVRPTRRGGVRTRVVVRTTVAGRKRQRELKRRRQRKESGTRHTLRSEIPPPVELKRKSQNY